MSAEAWEMARALLAYWAHWDAMYIVFGGWE